MHEVMRMDELWGKLAKYANDIAAPQGVFDPK